MAQRPEGNDSRTHLLKVFAIGISLLVLASLLVALLVGLAHSAQARQTKNGQAENIAEEVLADIQENYLYGLDSRCKKGVQRAAYLTVLAENQEQEDLAEDLWNVLEDRECVDQYTRLRSKKQTKNRIKDREGNSVNAAVFSTTSQGNTYEKISPIEKQEGIAYIHITQFGTYTPNEFRTAVQTMYADNSLECRILLDLRDNFGGLVTETLDIAALFAPKRGITLLTRQSRTKEKVTVADSITTGVFSNCKTVGLINRYCVSACEIFAGLLKEWGIRLVGEKTYGKGVTQKLISYGNGDYIYECDVTYSEYFIGQERTKVHGIGVLPTDPVADMRTSPYSVTDQYDAQLEKAFSILMEEQG